MLVAFWIVARFALAVTSGAIHLVLVLAVILFIFGLFNRSRV
ncbi:MAG: hypothetical protein JWN25_1401 [Verrucomicrobiales bacterium]|nr:hypothetical protein [Verrucomicrobiales bacterium]